VAVADALAVVDGTTETDRGSGATGRDDADAVADADAAACNGVGAADDTGDDTGEVNAPATPTADFFSGAMGRPPWMAP